MPTYTVTTADYTDQALNAFLNMLKGGAAGSDYAPTFVDVGIGGNYDLTGHDTGNRVAPDPTETEVRKRIFRARIITAEVIGGEKIKYTAVAEPHECISSNINELGLISSNGTMIAHWVGPETGPSPSPATTYSKSGYITVYFEWELNLTISF